MRRLLLIGAALLGLKGCGNFLGTGPSRSNFEEGHNPGYEIVEESPPPVAGAFSISSATAGDGQVVLAWGDSSDASTYIVQYGTSSGSYPTTFSTTATSPTTITSLNNGTTYYFMVTAVAEGGNTNASAEASATPLEAPSALSYDEAEAVYTYNIDNASLSIPIPNNTPTVTGSVTSYSISPNLNALTGLDFNSSTGVISGTPTTTTAATNYTILASNSAGSTSTTVSIRTAPGFTVNDSGDADDSNTGDQACSTAGLLCTLRAALSQVLAMSATSRVIVVPAYTILLTSSFPNVNHDLEIIGAGRDSTILNAGANAYRFFSITSGNPTVTISKLKLQNSTLSAAIQADSTGATLNLDRVRIQDFNVGAGATYLIYTGSGGVNLNLNDVVVQDNISGRSIFCNANSTCNVIDSSFIGNTSDNLAALSAGGSGHSLTVESSLFVNNVASNANAAAIEGANLQITNCTVVGNQSLQAAIVGGTIVNSTITLNSASQAGAGGGIRDFSSIVNSIISGNTSNFVDDNCAGSGVSLGYNLSNTSVADCPFNQSGDLANTDPLLNGLGNNGGATLTMDLLPGSPAIDAGSNASCPTLDQRGQPRPAGARCDIGAFESQ